MPTIRRNTLPGRGHNGTQRPTSTPERLIALQSDEIFVFDSSLDGRHGVRTAALPDGRRPKDFVEVPENARCRNYPQPISCGLADVQVFPLDKAALSGRAPRIAAALFAPKQSKPPQT